MSSRMADGATNRGAEERSPLGSGAGGRVLLPQGFGKAVPGDARKLLTGPAWAAHSGLGVLGTLKAGGAALVCFQESEAGDGMSDESLLLQAPLQTHPGQL